MKNYSLHEIAKFASGLVAADFLSLIWFSTQPHVTSMHGAGMTFTQGMLLPGLVFDIALFLMLVHYGWNVGQIPRIRERTYLMVAGVIFTIVAVVHIWRVFFGITVEIDGWTLPLWLSWIGVLITTYLAYTSFHLAARMPRK